MTDRAAVAEWLWHAHGQGARLSRALLTPASVAYGAIMARRNRRFDAGVDVSPTAIPTLSVGNLSVGGTGKTPVAAWCASELARLGARPGIVLRGYGDDEPRVHQLLNPGVPVVTNPDRIAGVASAAELGADVAVLDDGFQHRRAARVVDLVLVSADRWHGPPRLLPAGPWREPLSALGRATVAVITVKAAGSNTVAGVRAAISAAAPQLPQAVVSLVPAALGQVAIEPDASGKPPAVRALHTLVGETVHAISGIGDPDAFEAQLQGLGATVQGRRYPDHHAFTVAEVAQLAHAIPPSGTVVCTLKDAVKLAPLWPRAAPPLWYVSQTLEVRLGSEVLQSALSRVLAARDQPGDASPPTAG